MVGANGLLPNHRAHQFKVIGMYEFSKEYRLAGTLIAASGRPKELHQLLPDRRRRSLQQRLLPFLRHRWFGTAPRFQWLRSAVARLPPVSAWIRRHHALDLHLEPQLRLHAELGQNNLTVQADVLNVLNRQVARQIYPRYAASRTEADARYGQELSYSTPRTMRLTVRYDF